MRDNTLSKKERLTNYKVINKVFSKSGKPFFCYPILISVIHFTEEYSNKSPLQILISVSKKKIKKASDRNVIRRRIREGYRLNKNILSNLIFDNSQFKALTIIYLSKELLPYADIESSIKKLLHDINKNYQ